VGAGKHASAIARSALWTGITLVMSEPGFNPELSGEERAEQQRRSQIQLAMLPAAGRPGSIDVPAGCPLLIVEGDGAGRREVAHLIDTLIWVQADQEEAARRAAVRDLDPDAIDLANMPPGGTPPDHDGWTAEEIPFNTAQRTWERADIIVCGSQEIGWDPVTQIVIAPPLGPAG
jgi:hypothetical protein